MNSIGLNIALKMNDWKLREDNTEKLAAQLQRVTDYLLKRYRFSYLDSLQIGTINDDFIEQKVTFLFKFIMKVKAVIKDNDSSWAEEFEVKSRETAEEEIKEVVKFYNDTLNPREYPREFVKLL